MRNFEQLSKKADVSRLMVALSRQPELWKADRYWADHPVPVFRDVDSIILRFPAKAPYVMTDEERQAFLVSQDSWECADQPALTQLPEAGLFIFGIMTRLQGERLGRVLINRLPPGGHIIPHSDITQELVYYNRFHLILQSNDDVKFRAGDEYCKMQAGDLWWFDNTQEHEVYNNGPNDRIHLIVDVRTKVGTWNSHPSPT